MKKILLLGGSAQQVVAIETAKRLGCFTVLCDYLPDNPGQYAADKFYQVSTTDKKAVLAVAEAEGVDGVLAYASDPAAPTAAYVAEQLGLPTNPYKSVETLCDKDKFRSFLTQEGFNSPLSYSYHLVEDALQDADQFTFPIIVKPTDSSGSKGVTVLQNPDGLREALEFALSFSRRKKIIVEEFIIKKHPYLVGGDIFVQHGEVVLWGLMNCHRDKNVNPLVPVGKSYPPKISEEDMGRIKFTLQSIVDKLNIHFGALNVELVVDTNDRVWPIDIGPRCGGNMIPELLGMIYNVDLVEMSVKAAIGMPMYTSTPYYATYNLHTAESGIFEGIEFSDELEACIVRKCIYKKAGERVEYFDNAAKVIGIIFMKFEDEEAMDRMLDSICEHISIKIHQGGNQS